MSNAHPMLGRDIYLRHTDVVGRSFVQCHRVWDAEKFIASQLAVASKLNSDALNENPKAPQKATVEQLTEQQYLAMRKRP